MDESPVEVGLSDALLRRLDEDEAEYVARTIHLVDCPQLACTHTAADLDPADLKRAWYAVHAARLWRDNPTERDKGIDRTAIHQAWSRHVTRLRQIEPGDGTARER